MPNASALGFGVAIAAETVWGTPVVTSGAAARMRLTGGIGRTSLTTIASKEMTKSEVSDVTRVAASAGGTYNFELSYEGSADKEFSALLISILGSTFTSDVAKVANTRRSITIEESFSDITQFVSYQGALVESLRVEARIGDAVTGSFSFRSKRGVQSGTSVFTAPAAQNTRPIMNPIDSLQSLNWNGNPVAGPTAFTMELKRTVIDFPQLSNIDPAQLDPGTFEASGTISMYVADATYLADYLAFTERPLRIKLGGPTALSYQFDFAKVNLSDGGIESGGQNQPFIQTFNWMAKYDATDSTCKVTRDPS